MHSNDENLRGIFYIYSNDELQLCSILSNLKLLLREFHIKLWIKLKVQQSTYRRNEMH